MTRPEAGAAGIAFEDYRDRFTVARLERDEAGVLTIRLHTDDGPLVWGPAPHQELPVLFETIAADPANQAVVLTGTGDAFIVPNPGGSGRPSAAGWQDVVREGERLVLGHLRIPVPVIAAVNGPVSIHSEIAVLADVVLCAEDAYFQDAAHYPSGIVPGDGVQVIWPMLLGPNRGRHFLLTGAKLPAREALALGVAAEVLEPGLLVGRAQEVARDLARQDPAVVRATRGVLTRPLLRAMTDDARAGLTAEALAALASAERRTR